MGSRYIAWKLTYLCKGIGALSHFDPLIEHQMEALPNGLIISCSLPEANTAVRLHFRKDGHYIRPIQVLPEVYQSIEYQYTSEKQAMRIFKGKENPRAALARGEIVVKGQSSIIMTANRLVRGTLPFVIGRKKHFSPVHEPYFSKNFFQKKIRYLWYLIFQKDSNI